MSSYAHSDWESQFADISNQFNTHSGKGGVVFAARYQPNRGLEMTANNAVTLKELQDSMLRSQQSVMYQLETDLNDVQEEVGDDDSNAEYARNRINKITDKAKRSMSGIFDDAGETLMLKLHGQNRREIDNALSAWEKTLNLIKNIARHVLDLILGAFKAVARCIAHVWGHVKSAFRTIKDFFARMFSH